MYKRQGVPCVFDARQQRSRCDEVNYTHTYQDFFYTSSSSNSSSINSSADQHQYQYVPAPASAPAPAPHQHQYQQHQHQQHQPGSGCWVRGAARPSDPHVRTGASKNCASFRGSSEKRVGTATGSSAAIACEHTPTYDTSRCCRCASVPCACAR